LPHHALERPVEGELAKTTPGTPLARVLAELLAPLKVPEVTLIRRGTGKKRKPKARVRTRRRAR
jgi:hypothetical protein